MTQLPQFISQDEYSSRINVYHDTQQRAMLEFPNIAISGKYTESDLLGIRPKRGPKPIVTVVNNDTLDEFVNLRKEGFKPVLLNMANESVPGGGVLRGCAAQEENIFRRTNYFMTLTQNFYPITGAEVIYSKDVVLFKSNEKSGYKPINPIKVSIIACASIRQPPLNQNAEFRNKDDADLQYRKICMIFKSAIANRNDAMVLSAFGCGAYRCPSQQVAELFKHAIAEYGAYFKKIVFAIIQPPDDYRNNFEIFQNVLKTY